MTGAICENVGFKVQRMASLMIIYSYIFHSLFLENILREANERVAGGVWDVGVWVGGGVGSGVGIQIHIVMKHCFLDSGYTEPVTSRYFSCYAP